MTDSIDLVVPNIVEFNLRHPAVNVGPAIVSRFARRGGVLVDQSVFWTFGPRVLLLPAGWSPNWLTNVHAALGVAEPPVVSPSTMTGMVVRDLLSDGRAQALLRERLAGRRSVRLVAWGATPELYLLASVVTGWGFEVRIDGTGERDYWASLYLDSKASCQDLAGYVPEMKVVQSFTAGSLPELRGALEVVLRDGRRALVRSSYGVGGEGSAVVSSEGRGIESFWNTMHREAMLGELPLVVQPYLEHATTTPCPAVDLLIGDAGVERIETSAMTVDRFRFQSVVVGRNALSSRTAERVLRLGNRIGDVAHSLGFRGWFCVDFLLDADDELYVTEFNARRSGAMAALSLLGRWVPTGHIVHSVDELRLRVPPGATYERDLQPHFERLWARGTCVYPTSVRGLRGSRPSIGLVTAGATAQLAEDVAADLTRAIGHAAACDEGGDHAPTAASAGSAGSSR